jgi:phenylpropionate dioxygenase-like ring-hydroxylating dioxygenase large terminal subunit
MGNLLRRFWMPGIISHELPEPDCAPIRLKLLGEELVAWRNTDGSVGVIQNACPHRGASLFFGRNEENGLRCVYHGWKFDVTGACTDMPNEPAESNFKHKIKAAAYATQEAGGVVWIYMGPPERKPSLPRPEWTLVPAEQRVVSHYIQENNWVQGVEGGIDSSHVSFLHSTVASHRGGETDGYRVMMASDKAPEFRVATTDFGILIGARRRVQDNKDYWRVTPFSLPFYTVIPGVPGRDAPFSGHGWVPIDDENCWLITYSWHPSRPMSDFGDKPGHNAHYVPMQPGTRKPRQARDNDYEIDRDDQRTKSYTGITNGSIQDRGIQETMGAIYDRTMEHLGSADTAIIMMRRQLMKLARDLENGSEPYAAQHGELLTVRSAGFFAEPGASFVELSEPIVRGGLKR